MPLALADTLDERHIALQLRARAQPEAISEIVDRLAKTETVPEAPRFLEEVLAREAQGPTLGDNGVAFPHARTDLVEQIVVAVGRSRAGIRWNENGDRAHLIFLFAVPRQLVKDYLVVIGALARLTKNAELRSLLLHAATPAAFLDALRSAPSL